MSLPVKIEIRSGDIVELAKMIARWVEAAVNRHDDAARHKVQQAIPDVIKSMTLLASEKRAFADIYADCEAFEAQGVADQYFDYCSGLESRREKIVTEIQKIIARLAQADAAWSSDNIELIDATKDLLLGKERLASRTQGADATQVAAKLKQEADKLIEVAGQLSNARQRL